MCDKTWNAPPAIPGPCTSCGVETVTHVPGFWLCQSCAELGFTGPVDAPEVSQAVSQGSDKDTTAASSASLQGSKRAVRGVRTSHPLPRKALARKVRSYCPECQATQRINRYDPNGKIHSIITTHQPACPVLPARRKTQHHD